MKINILMASSRGYLPYLAACFASVLANAGEDEAFELYLATFTGELEDSDIARLKELRSIRDFGLHLVEIDPGEVDGFYESVHTKNMYLRLFVPEKLVHLERIIYLDCDMLVLGSLRGLVERDLGSSILGAALDSNVILRKGPVWEYVQRISTQYFNSGMLVMNLEAMRQDGFTQRLQGWLKNAGELMFPDQDALNTLYRERVRILPLRYNAQFPLLAALGSSEFGVSHPDYSEIEHPVILHFCTQQKPWLYMPEPPYKREFNHYLGLTAWRGMKPVDRSITNILRKHCGRVLRMGRIR